MKSTASHLTLIIVISAMSSLNLAAQKRFDNPEHKRKVLITKEGPKSTITESWVPVDSTNTNRELFMALYTSPGQSSLKKSDTTRISKPNQRLTTEKRFDYDQPKSRKGRTNWVLLKGNQ